jgi:tetratricopeptide (TPR) repeat protein
VALSEDLELFRAVVGKLTSAKRFEPRVPTRIFAFARTEEYRPFAPASSVGFFGSGLRENVVALDASGAQRIDAGTVLFHEYTHFLLHNQNSVALPLWYDEGFSEFMGTVRFEKDEVFIGAAPMYRRTTGAVGDTHNLETIIRASSLEGWDDFQISMFYLQSWQLVHYYMLGPGKQAKIGPSLARYLRLLEQGEDEVAALESAFGMDFNALWREISRYNRLSKIPAIRVPRDAFAPEEGQQVRAAAPAEVAVQLGFLALAERRIDLAAGYFARASAADPDRARAHAGLGVVTQLGEHGEQARPHFERALALAPDDYQNHLELAEWIHQTAEAQKRVDLLPEAREHYQRAIELAPEIPEGHAMLGSTYLLTDEDPAAGIQSLERARRLLPGEVSLLLPLARLYQRAGRNGEARAAARRVARWSHGEAGDEAAELLEQLGEAGVEPPD